MLQFVMAAVIVVMMLLCLLVEVFPPCLAEANTQLGHHSATTRRGVVYYVSLRFDTICIYIAEYNLPQSEQ